MATSDARHRYLIPDSKFDYSKVRTCSVLPHPFKIITEASFEECKLFCSYYEPCEGFQLVDQQINANAFEHIESASIKACVLIADLDFGDSCQEDELDDFYIPFTEENAEGFVLIQGELASTARMIGAFDNLPFDECSSQCSKTLACQAFAVTEAACTTSFAVVVSPLDSTLFTTPYYERDINY
jgi:hypothetical protein